MAVSSSVLTVSKDSIPVTIAEGVLLEDVR
jgi:hypothetical protein